MKALENRTIDSKREMDILDTLQDIRARNARNERVGQSIDLVARIGTGEVELEENEERKRLEDEDEILIRDLFPKIALPTASTAPLGSISSSNVVTVKRKADDVEPALHSLLPGPTRTLILSKSSPATLAKKKKLDVKNSLGIKLVKRTKMP